MPPEGDGCIADTKAMAWGASARRASSPTRRVASGASHNQRPRRRSLKDATTIPDRRAAHAAQAAESLEHGRRLAADIGTSPSEAPPSAPASGRGWAAYPLCNMLMEHESRRRGFQDPIQCLRGFERALLECSVRCEIPRQNIAACDGCMRFAKHSAAQAPQDDDDDGFGDPGRDRVRHSTATHTCKTNRIASTSLHGRRLPDVARCRRGLK